MHQLAEAAVAGSIAGLVVDISLFPLDTLKTWRQQKNYFYGFFSGKKWDYLSKNRYNVQKSCYYSHSLRSLYRGLAGMAVGSMPSCE
ncbi:uncharacterized protein T551_01802 [Pneumocystis jirovecii RU7]|uniref:Uncharacterized protein n=1 Tax=Pneumocystis jirovecii (strain RU7) TaxID=1408657 RepID=A0A0W4ZQ69_PNEJ7|nr:uncharacterized protein T551_01802 [Pneumocystis jirovecii RU7]KTW30519.1 hypothetical protein T551_01802 [Pneumocystis jirovecii RU7]